MNDLHAPVLEKLMLRSKPSILVQKEMVMIPRQKVLSDLLKMFSPEPREKTKFIRFGVVIGPSGSGKTTALGKCATVGHKESCIMK